MRASSSMSLTLTRLENTMTSANPTVHENPMLNAIQGIDVIDCDSHVT